MSALAFIHLRDKKNDFLFFGNDTAVVKNTPFKKDGVEYSEKYIGLSTKSLYVPHVKTLVSVAGNSWLSRKFHAFIDDATALTGFDDVLVAVNYFFHDYFKETAKGIKFTTDPNDDNFLGAIILSGPSYNQTLEVGSLKRERPILMTRKFLVYKDRVEDFGWMNPEIDDYEGSLCNAVHPKIPDEIYKVVEEESKPVFENGFYLGSIFLLKRWLMENNRLYNESGRNGTVTAGEIHGNVLHLSTDEKSNQNLTCTQMMLHRFDDFEDVLKEIREKNG